MRREPKVALADQVIRKSPDRAGAHIGKLKKGSRVYVVNMVKDDSGVVRYEIELKRGKTGWVRERSPAKTGGGGGVELLHTENEDLQRAAMLKEVSDARRKELEALKLGDLLKIAEERAEFDDVASKEKLYLRVLH